MRRRIRIFLSLMLIVALTLALNACGESSYSAGSSSVNVRKETTSVSSLSGSDTEGASDELYPETEAAVRTESASEAETLSPEQTNSAPEKDDLLSTIQENGEYSSKEEVAAYLYLYGHLPSNYITKKAAQKLGWSSSEGNLWEVAPGKSIGGDYFGNYEGILPEDHTYHECDIDFDGGYRNAKRIIYSEDGLIYYTEDHYNTFELLYGEE